MKINSLEIKDVGGIHHLKLDFNRGLNVICGVNGVGKTTILECIAHSFSEDISRRVRRNSKAEKGYWKISVDGHVLHMDIQAYKPMDMQYSHGNCADLSHKVIYVREERTIEYEDIRITRRLNELKNMRSHRAHLVGHCDHLGDSIKAWFIAREAFKHEKSMTKSEIYNTKIIKGIFNKLDRQVNYSHIEHDTFDIILETPRGEVYFEYLSAGFKSALFIMLDIIKRIEVNFNHLKIKICDFDGVILVDELDAHLHPTWQGTLMSVLRETFQRAQIIVTTHSPHMIQEADADEIIALGLTDRSEVVKLELEKSEYGFKGWTVEEILEDVMGMEGMRSQVYIEMRDRFEQALREENFPEAKASYDVLLKMLHPRSPLKKIFELQLGTIGE